MKEEKERKKDRRKMLYAEQRQKEEVVGAVWNCHSNFPICEFLYEECGGLKQEKEGGGGGGKQTKEDNERG